MESKEIIKSKLSKISRNVKIIWWGIELPADKDPWKEFAGRIKIGKEVDVDEMLDLKGFEESNAYI